MDRINVSIYLDTRRKKANGKYPVKLRIFTTHPRKQKLYATTFEFTDSEFQSIWETVKPRSEYKENRIMLQEYEALANRTAMDLPRFGFEAFEKAFFKTNTGDSSNVISLFDEIIQLKSENGAVSTAEKYQLAKVCIQSYLKYKGQKTEYLSIDLVDVSFLQNLSFYCEQVRGLSPATIGIYFRNLRTVYNLAIERGTANRESYPFKMKSFSIPTSRKVNKALTESELKSLWSTTPQNEKQAIAKDFWFFSYYSFGMNTRDICELKHTSIQGESFYYVRAKTRNTKKEVSQKEVPLNRIHREIIARRLDTSSSFLFGIIHPTQTPKQRHERIKLFNRSINKHFRKFAEFAGIDPALARNIGTYHARHSFATVMIQKGNSPAFLSEILHDGNLKVTENYINSFPKEAFRELSNDMILT